MSTDKVLHVTGIHVYDSVYKAAYDLIIEIPQCQGEDDKPHKAKDLSNHDVNYISSFL